MKIDGKTQLIGLLGWPVSHTKSPILHNAVAQAHSLNFAYLPLAVHPDAVEAAVRGLPALGFLGVNVTVPHKQVVMPLLDVIDPAAQAIGAVNTILFSPRPEGGYPPKSAGFNTDWIGFQQDLAQHNVPIRGRDCVVLGAGGSARAVVYTLLKAEANVFLCARRPEQAQTLIADMRVHFPQAQISATTFDQIGDTLAQVVAPLIVNTTPIGMHPNVDESIWPDDRPFPVGSFVYDLVYTPAETCLMKQAHTAGCESANGLGMLLGQAAEAFRIWTGIDPDLAVMEAALK
ncbi:MAG: shikimate dehydrogenase [Cellvibrionaceae bacterium]|jgi:shikimate dehydrogenase